MARLALLLTLLGGLAQAERQEGTRSKGPPAGPSPVDYAKETKDIVDCGLGHALPQEIVLIPTGPSDHEEGRKVSRRVACFMKLVQDMRDDDDDDEDEQKDTVDITLKVDAESLDLIVQFAEMKLKNAGPEMQNLNFSVVPRPLSGPLHETESISEEDAKFMDDIAQNLDTLFRLTNSVNFVNCPPLLELCTARIAQMLIGKTPKEIREIFPEVFATKEEAEVEAAA